MNEPWACMLLIIVSGNVQKIESLSCNAEQTQICVISVAHCFLAMPSKHRSAWRLLLHIASYTYMHRRSMVQSNTTELSSCCLRSKGASPTTSLLRQKLQHSRPMSTWWHHLAAWWAKLWGQHASPEIPQPALPSRTGNCTTVPADKPINLRYYPQALAVRVLI